MRRHAMAVTCAVVACGVAVYVAHRVLFHVRRPHHHLVPNSLAAQAPPPGAHPSDHPHHHAPPGPCRMPARSPPLSRGRGGVLPDSAQCGGSSARRTPTPADGVLCYCTGAQVACERDPAGGAAPLPWLLAVGVCTGVAGEHGRRRHERPGPILCMPPPRSSAGLLSHQPAPDEPYRPPPPPEHGRRQSVWGLGLEHTRVRSARAAECLHWGIIGATSSQRMPYRQRGCALYHKPIPVRKL